jgi:Conserved TM helix
MQTFDLILDMIREFMHQAAVFLPRLALALVIVAVGWFLAKAARFAVEKGLRAINFNILTERAGTDHFLQQGGLSGDTTSIFGIVMSGIVIVATLIVAFNSLGLTYITDLLQRVELFAPKLIVAMLVVVLGSYFARFVGGVVNTYCVDAKIPDADSLAGVARYVILAFVIMIALTQVEVGGDIVQKTFLILLAGVVLCLALAFGLGGRDWAAAMLERWWPQRKN